MSPRRVGPGGVMLSVTDAVAISRILRLFLEGEKFDNPLLAAEFLEAAKRAAPRLAAKVAAKTHGVSQ